MKIRKPVQFPSFFKDFSLYISIALTVVKIITNSNVTLRSCYLLYICYWHPPLYFSSSQLYCCCYPAVNYQGKVITNLIKRNDHIVQFLDKDGDILTKAAKNKVGKFIMFIVNSPVRFDEYIHLVKVTACKAAGEQCAQLHLHKCKQEYSDHKLVALSETGEELVVDTRERSLNAVCLLSMINLNWGVQVYDSLSFNAFVENPFL